MTHWKSESAATLAAGQQLAEIIKDKCLYEGVVQASDRIIDLVPDSDDISMTLIPEIERRCFCELQQSDLFRVSTVADLLDLIARSKRAEIEFPVLALPFGGGGIILASTYDELAYSRRSVISSGRLTKYHLVDISGRTCRVSWVKIDFSRNGLWHYLRDRVGGVKLGLTDVEKRYSLPELQSVIHGVLGGAEEDIVSERRRECVGRVKSFEELFACFEDAPSDFSE